MTSRKNLQARNLIPGMVIVDWRGEKWHDKSEPALVVSQSIPAGSVPLPEARGLCEPGLVLLKHLRDDRWVQTHYFTYACFKLDEDVKVNDSLRVQYPSRKGRFLTEEERVKMMNGRA